MTTASAAAEPIPLKTVNIKAKFSDVVTMWATIVDYVSFVYPDNGSTFIQSLCYQLINSQGGIPITGGAEIRDLYEAHLAINQEVCAQPIYIRQAGYMFNPETQKFFFKEAECANQTPIYMSTACGKKVAFQIVSQDKRCKEIRYYAKSFNRHELGWLLDNDKTSLRFGRIEESSGFVRIDLATAGNSEPMEIDTA